MAGNAQTGPPFENCRGAGWLRVAEAFELGATRLTKLTKRVHPALSCKLPQFMERAVRPQIGADDGIENKFGALDHVIGRNQAHFGDQIGRASCRERVSQYV